MMYFLAILLIFGRIKFTDGSESPACGKIAEILINIARWNDWRKTTLIFDENIHCLPHLPFYLNSEWREGFIQLNSHKNRFVLEKYTSRAAWHYMIDRKQDRHTKQYPWHLPQDGTIVIGPDNRNWTAQNAERSKHDHTYFVEEVKTVKYTENPSYSIYKHEDGTLSKIGDWNATEQRLLKHKDFLQSDDRILKVATIDYPPYHMRVHRDNDTVYTGFSFEIFKEISRNYNFKYRIIESVDGYWGSPNDDGTFNGMIGMVERGEADIAVGAFTVTAARESAIDFTWPYFEDDFSIIVAKTRSNSSSVSELFSVFRPFSLLIWILIIAAIFVCTFLFHGTLLLASQRKNDSNAVDIHPLLDSLMGIYSQYVWQNSSLNMNNISSQCILSFWLFFSIMITTLYTADLIGYLTVSSDSLPINSLQELAESNQLLPLSFPGSSVWSYFKESSDPVNRKIYQKIQHMPIVDSVEDGLRYVQRNSHVFITDSSAANFAVNNACGQYSIAEETFYSNMFAFALPTKSPYLKAFNSAIMKMQETGLVARWKKKWLDISETCKKDANKTATALNLRHFYGLFIVYGSSIVLSLIFFICEMLSLKREQSVFSVSNSMGRTNNSTGNSRMAINSL